MSETRAIKRNVWLYFTGLITSRLGTQIYSFAISLFILKFTQSSLLFSISIVFSMLPQVVLSPVAGILADKWHKKTLVVATDVLSGLTMLALWGYTQFSSLGLLPIYLSTFFLACFNAVFATSFAAAVPELVDEAHLVRINAMKSIADSGALIAGPIIGGMVYAFIDIRLFILLNGISFLLSATSELFINFRLNPRTEHPGAGASIAFMDSMREGIAYLKKDKLASKLVINIMFINLFGAVFSVAFPYGLINVIKVSDQMAGVANGSFAVGMLLMSLILSQKTSFKSPLRASGIGIAVIGVSFSVIGFFYSFGADAGLWVAIGITITGFIMGLGEIGANMPISYLFQTRIDPNYLGRLTGILSALSISIFPLGTLLTGLLIGITDTAGLLIISGLMVTFLAFKLILDKSLKTDTIETETI